MALKLMYITNRPEIAEIAQRVGVDRIWIDMEYIGKEDRQAGMNTVKSYHTLNDIKIMRPHITSSELLVRINPIHNGSKEEIEETINNGADIIMLPMFKTKNDVETFLKIVNRRVKTILLLETVEAVENIESILELPGITEVHIGLNDLHLAYKKNFMFELLVDGTVEKLCNILKSHNITYGFGGIARVGYGELPAELIITEHYRLGSSMAILSRGFCNANTTPDVKQIEQVFSDGVKGIRLKEKEISSYNKDDFDMNLKFMKEIVNNIVQKKINSN